MKLKKVELTDMCREKKLPVTGTKADLTARLVRAMQLQPSSVQNTSKVLPDASISQSVKDVEVTTQATLSNETDVYEKRICESEAALAEAIARNAILQESRSKLEIQCNKTSAFADELQKELQNVLEAARTSTLAANEERLTLENDIKRLKSEVSILKETAQAAKVAQIESVVTANQLNMLQAKLDKMQAEFNAETAARAKAEAIAAQAVLDAENAVASIEDKSLLEASALALEQAEAKIASLSEDRSAKEAQVSAKAEQVANLCLALQDKVQHMQAEIKVESAARQIAELSVAELESLLAAEKESKANQESAANSIQQNSVAEKAEKVAALCMKLQQDVQHLKSELATESAARLKAEGIATAAADEATASKALAEKKIAAAEITFKALADRAAEKSSEALKTAEEIQNNEIVVAPTESNSGTVAAGIQLAIEAAKENADKLKETIGAFSKDSSKTKWLSFGKKDTDADES
jgi:hypothetical protein